MQTKSLMNAQKCSKEELQQFNSVVQKYINLDHPLSEFISSIGIIREPNDSYAYWLGNAGRILDFQIKGRIFDLVYRLIEDDELFHNDLASRQKWIAEAVYETITSFFFHPDGDRTFELMRQAMAAAYDLPPEQRDGVPIFMNRHKELVQFIRSKTFAQKQEIRELIKIFWGFPDNVDNPYAY